MERNKAGSFILRISAAAMLIMVITPASQAAERVPWDKLVGVAEDGSIDVITRDGRRHHAQSFWLDPGTAELSGPGGDKQTLDRKEVTRIDVRFDKPRKHYLHHITESAQIPLFLAELCSEPGKRLGAGRTG